MTTLSRRFQTVLLRCCAIVLVPACDCPEFENPGHHTYEFGPRPFPGADGLFQLRDGVVTVDGDDLLVAYTGPEGQHIVVTFARVADTGTMDDTSDSLTDSDSR